MCYCSEGKPWYLRELLLRQKTGELGPGRARGNGKHINLLTREFRQTVALYGCPAARNIWRGEVRSERRGLVFPPRTGDCSLPERKPCPVPCFAYYFSAPVAPLEGAPVLGLDMEGTLPSAAIDQHQHRQ